MSDQDPQLQVTVEAQADGAPVDRLADAMGQVKNQTVNAGKAAKDASDSFDGLGRGALGAGHLLHGLERAAEGSARGAFTAARGAEHLLSAFGLGPLGEIALAVGGITAGIMALSRAFGQSHEEAKKLADQNEKTLQGMEQWRTLHLDDVQKQFAMLAEQIDIAAKSTEQLYQAQMRYLESRAKAASAAREVEKELALQALKPGDTEGRKRVEQSFKEQDQSASGDLGVQKAFAAMREAEKDAASKQAKADNTLKQGEDLAAAFEHAMGAIERLKTEIEDLQFRHIGANKEERKAIENDISGKEAEIKKRRAEQAARVDAGVKLGNQYDSEISAANAASVDAYTARNAYQAAISNRTAGQARGMNEQSALDYESQQRAEQDRRKQQLQSLEASERAAAERERADKEHLRAAQHGEAPEELENLRSAAAGAKLNLQSATASLIADLTAAVEADNKAKQQIAEQIRQLREKQDSTVVQ